MLQLSLHLAVPQVRCLARLDSLCDDFNAPEEQIIDAAECGAIPFVFNIATNEDTRRELRVWKPVVEALRASGGSRALPQNLSRNSGTQEAGFGSPEFTLEKVLAELIPAREVRSSELEIWWRCSHQHISSLIAAGHLPIHRRPVAAHGPQSFWLLRPAGLRDFLRSRSLDNVKVSAT